MSRTLEQLREIPTLAALVAASSNAPARQSAARSGGRLVGSPMPPDVAAADLLRDVRQALAAAVQAVTEERRARDMWEPEPPEPATILGDCGYLLVTVETWGPTVRQQIKDTARTSHNQLARWTGETKPRPPRYLCPACEGTLHRDTYSATGEHQSLGCEDCGRIIHPKEVAHLAKMQTPTPLLEIADMLGITERHARRWITAGLASPVSNHTPTRGRPDLYLPADMARIQRITKAG